MKKTLQFVIFQYPQGPSFHQLMVGDRIVSRSPHCPEGPISGMIDVYYEDYTAYSYGDLLAAIERATASGEDLLLMKLYDPHGRIRQPIGRVTLYPRMKWMSKELTVFEFLRPIIEQAIEQENA
jgi:hypothetical protein